MEIFDRYNDYYENYELNPGIYMYELDTKDRQLLDIAIWIINNKISIRQAAKEFCMSKSALHRDLNSNLKYLSIELYICIQKQFKINKSKYFK